MTSWREWVAAHGGWQPHSYEGYQPLAVDIPAFGCPWLQGWLGKFFSRIANRAVTGIGFGLVVQVGHYGEQRLPLLKQLICADPNTVSESQFIATVLKTAGQSLGAHEVVVHDAGASIAEMQTAKVARYVVGLDRKCTARRNQLPPRPGGKGRPPEYGVRVQGWRDGVRSDQKVAPDNATFTIWGYHDPLYQEPLVLGTNLLAQPTTILHLYLDRWLVEEVPLVCK